MVIGLRESVFRSPGLLAHCQELFLFEILSLFLHFFLNVGVDQLLDVLLELVSLLVLLKYNQIMIPAVLLSRQDYLTCFLGAMDSFPFLIP